MALEPLENFKDIESSVEAHRRAIRKFSKDRSSSVLAITSIQGSGKTTAIVNEFANSRDAILLTQSNEKLEEIVEWSGIQGTIRKERSRGDTK